MKHILCGNGWWHEMTEAISRLINSGPLFHFRYLQTAIFQTSSCVETYWSNPNNSGNSYPMSTLMPIFSRILNWVSITLISVLTFFSLNVNSLTPVRNLKREAWHYFSFLFNLSSYVTSVLFYFNIRWVCFALSVFYSLLMMA